VRTVVDYSAPLTRFVSDGLLDIAVLYVPQQRPDLTVQRLMEENLVMVSGTRDRDLETSWSEDYIYVDWGDDFRHHHALAFPEARTPRLQIDDATLALQFVIGRGCSAYLLESAVRPRLERGELHRVPDAPVFPCPTYVACPTDPIHPERLRIALEELHQLIAADRDESARTSPPAVNPSRSA
jgi:DNA-binding transcriptional LysR family regulator